MQILGLCRVLSIECLFLYNIHYSGSSGADWQSFGLLKTQKTAQDWKQDLLAKTVVSTRGMCSVMMVLTLEWGEEEENNRY